MNENTLRPKLLRLALVCGLAGTLFQWNCVVNSLDRAQGVGERLARNFNPCGTIIDCDPLEWDLLFHDYPDWNLDPTCTVPGLCGGLFPVGTGGDAGA